MSAHGFSYVPGPGIKALSSRNSFCRPEMLNAGAVLMLPSELPPRTAGMLYTFGAGTENKFYSKIIPIKVPTFNLYFNR